MTPVRSITSLALVVVFAFCSAVAQSTAHPQILTDDGCGKSLPVTLGNPQDFKQFEVDIEAFKKNEAAKMLKVLDGVCQNSAASKQAVNDKIDSIRLINAQGAEEPNPYVGGRVLLIEFVGGDFKQAPFRATLIRALAKGSVTRAGFDCAKATRDVEHLICDEPDLAQADEGLSSTYRDALAATKGNDAKRKQLQQSQRDWLAARDKQCVTGKQLSESRARTAAITCLLQQYQDRTTALENPGAAAATPATTQTKSGTAYFDKNSNGELDFDPHADGTAQFTLTNGSERGICDLESADSPAKQTTPGTYLYTDDACKVTFKVSANSIAVTHEGNCFSMYCGVHAPDFDAVYKKK